MNYDEEDTLGEPEFNEGDNLDENFDDESFNDENDDFRFNEEESDSI